MLADLLRIIYHRQKDYKRNSIAVSTGGGVGHCTVNAQKYVPIEFL